ncbi:DUF421 domain-containing protein [Marixanthomonas spongiae]|uniref:DUF421 domain-containing protein n=1 Tax=Marixanthomonas spongiae TaxID=2174845 RepID=A0A2U0I551_9FLAO|nr:YetF domain-containing protein [Marixanthomonas spongiae]PVW16237.1 DUF421 domain-containing protein [Marixanthomonas spongiae]
MENWISVAPAVLGKVLISILLIFTGIIIITRIAGLRTFSKMSSFDFAATIAIGSILASIVLNTDQSLVKGVIALGGIIAFQSVFMLLKRKSNVFQKFATNAPLLLMKDGTILSENLKAANMGEDDLIAKLREANVFDLNEVHAAILESTGDVSILHTHEDKQLQDKILQGVQQ